MCELGVPGGCHSANLLGSLWKGLPFTFLPWMGWLMLVIWDSLNFCTNRACVFLWDKGCSTGRCQVQPLTLKVTCRQTLPLSGPQFPHLQVPF